MTIDPIALRRTVGVALSATLLACGGAPDARERESAESGGKPARETHAEGTSGGEGSTGSDFPQLATDIAAVMICDGLEGELAGLGGLGGGGPGEGRLWVRSCRSHTRGGVLHADVEATAWTWVEREQSSAGATFELSQYVSLDAHIAMDARVELDYRAREHIARIHIAPVRPPQADVRPRGEIEVDTQSIWGEIVGGVASVFASSPESQARDEIQQQGTEHLEGALDQGITVDLDLCNGEPRSAVDPLASGGEDEGGDEGGGHAETPIGSARWVKRQEVRLHATGLDAAGPFRPGAVPVRVDVHVREGGPVHTRLVCQEDATRVIDAWLAGGLTSVPDVEAVAEGRAAPGETLTLRAPTRCRVLALTTLEQGAEAASVFEIVARGRHSSPRALVPGCERPRAR